MVSDNKMKKELKDMERYYEFQEREDIANAMKSLRRKLFGEDIEDEEVAIIFEDIKKRYKVTPNEHGIVGTLKFHHNGSIHLDPAPGAVVNTPDFGDHWEHV